MAIAIVGTPTTGSATNGGDITLSLPAGLAQNDVVVVEFNLGQNAGAGGTSSAGWTTIGAKVNSPGNISHLQIFRKVMGASPDASIVLTGDGNASDSSSGIATGWRGVDTTTPEDGVALTTATGTGTNPDPASITPATTGAIAIIFAGIGLIDTTGTAAPSGYTDFTQVSSNDTNDTTSYFAWKSGLTGGVAENPGAFTGVGTAESVAYSIVLRPITAKVLTADAGAHTFAGTAVALKHAFKLTAGAGAHTFAGTAVGLRHGWKITAGAGAHTFAGTSITLKRTWKLTAGVGAHTFAGTTVSLKHAWRIAAGAGAHTFAGTNVSLNKGLRLTAATGAHTFAGMSVTLRHAWKLAVAAGAHSFTGTSVTLKHGWNIGVGIGAHTFAGTSVSLTIHAGPIVAGTLPVFGDWTIRLVTGYPALHVASDVFQLSVLTPKPIRVKAIVPDLSSFSTAPLRVFADQCTLRVRA